MKGYIKIEATTHEGREGFGVQADLEHITYMDRLQVMHSLCYSLNIDPGELKFMAELMDSGILDEAAEIKVLEDDTVPASDDDKCDCSCRRGKPKSRVNVIGVDANSTLMHDLLKMLFN